MLFNALENNYNSINYTILQNQTGELNKKLFIAVANGDFNTVKIFMDAGADANARDPKTRQPLVFSAVKWPQILQLLIARGADINAPFGGGDTALHIAAVQGVPESIHILITAGGQVNRKNTQGYTPLYLASSQIWVWPHDIKEKNILALLERGADPNIGHSNDKYYNKPLQIASPHVSLSTMKEFIRCGATVDDYPSNDCSLLVLAIFENDKDKLLYLINEANASINVKSPGDGMTPFLKAVESGNFDAMKLLLEKGANINAKDKYGRSALSIARERHLELLEWLISKGAK